MALIPNVATRIAPCFKVSRCSIHRWVYPTLKEMHRRREILGPEPPRPRSSWINWNFNAELFAFGKRLNEELPLDKLRTVFTHKSYIEKEEKNRREMGLSEAPLQLECNSRFEETGQKLLDDYIACYLRFTHPRFPEEGIQAVRKFLTSDEILGHVSSNIGTKDLILSEEFPPSHKMLANVFKAFLGAIAEQRGQHKAELFIQDFVLTQLIGRDVNEMWEIINPMGMLLDILKRDDRELPETRLLREAGRNTLQAVYNVGLYSCRKLIGMGPGETLAIAEEMASRDALKRLFGTRNENLQLPFGKLGHAATIPRNTINLSASNWSSKLVEDSTKTVSIKRHRMA